VAQRVQTILIDDISGEEITDGETINFQWRGVAYAIDLSEAHVTKFEKAIQPFLKAARREKANNQVRALPTRKSAQTDSQQLAKIREWAHENGMPVSERGRIAYEVRDAYEKAHNAEAVAV
jgi:hypothetical protein